MHVRSAAILLMESSGEISALNATRLTGNVLNADSSSRLRSRRTHAHNAMRSAIFLTLPATPPNAEDPDISIQGYRGKGSLRAVGPMGQRQGSGFKVNNLCDFLLRAGRLKPSETFHGH